LKLKAIQKKTTTANFKIHNMANNNYRKASIFALLGFAFLLISCNEAKKVKDAKGSTDSNQTRSTSTSLTSPSLAGKTLNFEMQKQPELNLCWAAVASSISKFYDTRSSYTVCDLANRALSRSTCCTDIRPCDMPWSLESALTITGNLRSTNSGMPSLDVIKNQITNNYVIALRVYWRSNDQGHFIVIHGFHDDGTVDVKDPWPTSNPGRVSLAELELFYQNYGQITHHYLTKKLFE
jgi:hypothetical protein